MIKRGGYLEKLFIKLNAGTEHLIYGRAIIAHWACKYMNELNSDDIRVLDIGLGTGTDLLNIRRNLSGKNVRFFGIECFQPNIEKAKQNGINVYPVNIETESIPVGDEYFDIVVANQIIEHTKEIFWIFGEMHRVLKRGGVAIIGIPNLASLHNRVILLFGEQPTCIEPLSAHVRGFTKPAFERFVAADGYFRLIEVKGSKPSFFRISTLSAALFFLIQRTNKEGNFIDVLESRFFETLYFRGGTQ